MRVYLRASHKIHFKHCNASYFQMTYVLELSIVVVHDPNTQDKFLCVVIVKNAVQIITKTKIYLLRDLFHGELLVRHTFTIEFNTQKPW